MVKGQLTANVLCAVVFFWRLWKFSSISMMIYHNPRGKNFFRTFPCLKIANKPTSKRGKKTQKPTKHIRFTWTAKLWWNGFISRAASSECVSTDSRISLCICPHIPSEKIPQICCFICWYSLTFSLNEWASKTVLIAPLPFLFHFRLSQISVKGSYLSSPLSTKRAEFAWYNLRFEGSYYNYWATIHHNQIF